MRRTFGASLALSGLVLGLLGSGPATAQTDGSPSAEYGSSDWRMVSAGETHTCGIRTSGRLYCWGDDSSGQLGDGGTNTNQPTPVQVVGGATNWTQVSLGDDHTCARRSTGRLFCWGNDDSGQLGDGGTNTSKPTPVQVAGAATNWTQVSLGRAHTCARRSTGRLHCWGWDGAGQLGDGVTLASRTIPAPVAGAATWTQFDLGDTHSCARRTSGRLYCWGADSQGQLGDGGTNTNQPTPVQVAGAATNWTQVSAGLVHTCARRSTGRLYCWGDDDHGQVGDGGTNTDVATPVQVSGGATDWTAPTSGGFHACARTSSRRLYCWGRDDSGQLGDGGTNTSRPGPTEVFAQG